MDLLTGDADVRSSKKTLKSSTWQKLTKAKKHGNKVDKWRNAELGEVQKRLNTTPYRTSASAERYGKYADNIFQHWDALWNFAIQLKVRKERFRAYIDAQKALDRIVDELCKPRPGNSIVLLLFGDGAANNLFNKVKKHVKGPSRKLFDAVVRRKKAICIWVDEFRTSKLDIYGEPVIHPPETRPEQLKPDPCKAEHHAQDAPGCRCFCSHHVNDKKCDAKRTKSRWCADHFKKQSRYNVCFSKKDQETKHGHRMWNRDVVAAINIGCLFFAQALGLDTARWKQGTKLETTKSLSWAEIFGRAGHTLPFSLPSTKPSV